MTTYNTGNPIGSTDARDRLDNSENMDILENSTTLNEHADRLGTMRKTRKGMEDEHDAQIAAHETEFADRILKMAFTPVGTFTSGATLTDARQTLLWEVSQGGDGHYYSWGGSFPMVVTAGGSPSPISAGSWVDRTDDSLRDEIRETVFQNMKRLAAEAGFNLVDGSFEEGAVISGWPDVVWCQTTGKYYQWHLDEAKTVAAGSTPETSGGVGAGAWRPVGDITLRTELATSDSGYLVDDSNITVQTPASGVVRTQHLRNADYISVKDFGAVGDGVTNDTDAIQAAIVYGKDNKVKVYIPSGVYIVTTLTVYPYTVLEGAGRTTELKLLDGYNGDVIMGVNSYNWFGTTDHHTVTNTCYNTELCNFVINGNVKTFDGTRTGNGIAIWGSRLRIWNIDIKNIAQNGMRTDYYDNDYDSSEPWYESTFSQIRIFRCGNSGWYCAGPHDLQANDVSIIDGSRVGNNQYDGLRVTSNCSGNFVNLHVSNTGINGGDLIRHRHAGNIEGPCRFAGGTTFEGSASACIRIASSGCQFDDSCAYYAPWGDNVNCYVMQLEGANLSRIRGKISGPTTERSSSMISWGLRFMTTAPTSSADINLMIDGCSAPVSFGNNTTPEQGPDGDGGYNKVVIQSYYSGPISYEIYGQPNTRGRTELDILLSGKEDQRIMSERQNKRFTMAAGASYQWVYKYRFGSTPVLTYSIDAPAAVPTNQVWTTGTGSYSTTFYNATGTSVTINATVERGLLDV